MPITSFRQRGLPSLNALRSFEAAARHASFTRAAEELCVTQGAVSRMVQSLEEELGLVLFHRLGRKLQLTPAGELYQAHICEALDRIGAATRLVKRMEGGSTLTVSALPTLTMRWLVPRLQEFQQRHPEILVDIVTHDGPVDVTTSTVDVVIAYGSGDWQEGEAELLMHEDMAVFCSSAILDRGAPLRSRADFLQYRLLKHTTRPDAWHRYLGTREVLQPVLDQSPGFEHFFMLIEAAAAGMGLALLPVFLVQEELKTGRLVQVGDAHRSPSAYYVIHARSAAKLGKVRLFKQWLLNQVEDSVSGQSDA